MQNVNDERTEVSLETPETGPVEELAGHAAYALDAEVRAVEEGHLARVLPDGSILVKAESQPGSYRVRIRRVAGGVVAFRCTCPSGGFRSPLPVPCKHAALAGRRLEREGLTRWRDGIWHLRERATVRAALASTIRPRVRPATLPDPSLASSSEVRQPHTSGGVAAGVRTAA